MQHLASEPEGGMPRTGSNCGWGALSLPLAPLNNVTVSPGSGSIVGSGSGSGSGSAVGAEAGAALRPRLDWREL